MCDTLLKINPISCKIAFIMNINLKEFSLALVEIVPVGAATEWGIHLKGANQVGEQTSDYDSIPRVLEIINPKSEAGEELLQLAGESYLMKLKYRGMVAMVAELQFGSPYLAYNESNEARRSFYVRRVHGVDDGHFGSVSDPSLPSAVGHKSRQ